MKRIVGTALIGLIAIFLFVDEWNFTRRTRTARAAIVQGGAFGRSGLTIADALYAHEGRLTKATLRAWYCHLIAGEHVQVRYLPNDPENVVLDGFWQRHHRSAIALAAFTLLAAIQVTTEAQKRGARRRRQSHVLLRDDYVGVSIGSPQTSALPIDTNPPLWDRDLDA